MTARLRILHAVRSDEFAGVEQFVRRLAIAQAQDGHTVFVLGGAEAEMRPLLQAAGVRYRPARSTLQVARTVAAGRRLVDVINTHMTAADVGAVIGAAGPHRPAVVATRHFARRRGSLGPSAAYRLLERLIDAEISISRAVAATAGVASTVVHTGIDLTPSHGEHERERIVLMAQRLQPEKRTDVGIRAFAASGIHRDGWMLDIAGEGAELADLRQLASELGIADATRFLGFRTDVPELMERAGMLLAPCPWEGLGLSVLEAMALALPTVASNAGGHAELLEALDPRALFRPDDVSAAAKSLQALAADQPGRQHLGAAMQERQQRSFTVRAQVDGTDAVYRRAIAARRGTPAGAGADRD